MRELNDKEKLDRCIAFLNRLQNIDGILEKKETYECIDDNDYYDGMEHIYIKSDYPFDGPYYSKNELEKIRDEAWHILADIT